jgi:hypothetical protein
MGILCYPVDVSTLLKEPQVSLRPPHEALQRLSRVTPSDRRLAAVLGTDNHSVSGWRKGTRKMRHPYLELIPYMDAVAERLAAAGVLEADLAYVLQQPWPSLGSRQPAEVLKEGALASVLDAVPVVAGRRPVEVSAESKPEEVEMPAWKQELLTWLESSLEASSSREPLYEDFVFIRGMSDEAASVFAVAAREAIATAETEEEWDRFLEPYWAAFTPPPRQAPALAAPADDDLIDEAEFDELILPIGAMVSRRFPRLA